jgi:hypothetical protein
MVLERFFVCTDGGDGCIEFWYVGPEFWLGCSSSPHLRGFLPKSAYTYGSSIKLVGNKWSLNTLYSCNIK